MQRAQVVKGQSQDVGKMVGVLVLLFSMDTGLGGNETGTLSLRN